MLPQQAHEHRWSKGFRWSVAAESNHNHAVAGDWKKEKSIKKNKRLHVETWRNEKSSRVRYVIIGGK
jgi:hypothetical protein